MNKLNSRTISINALAIALVCLSTMFLQFPIPLGYAHLGNCFILISGVFFGPVTGLLAGGIGSALSDLLTGYAQWIIPTLIIKGIMGFVIGYIANRTGLTVNMFKIRTAAASIVGIIIMIVGYFIGGSILYGSIYTRCDSDSGPCYGRHCRHRSLLCHRFRSAGCTSAKVYSAAHSALVACICFKKGTEYVRLS